MPWESSKRSGQNIYFYFFWNFQKWQMYWNLGKIDELPKQKVSDRNQEESQLFWNSWNFSLRWKNSSQHFTLLQRSESKLRSHLYEVHFTPSQVIKNKLHFFFKKESKSSSEIHSPEMVLNTSKTCSKTVMTKFLVQNFDISCRANGNVQTDTGGLLTNLVLG